MKVVTALKKMCEFCHFKRKGKKVYVRCVKNPRHKQRQGSGFCTIKTDVEIKKMGNSEKIGPMQSSEEIDQAILKLKIRNLINNKF